MLLVTNNGKVRISFGDLCVLRFIEGGHEDVLKAVRDLIHTGHKLLTHPLAGSVKPNETPYKSLIVSVEPHGFDADHAGLMANAIAVFDKFRPIGWELEERILRDFQLIDYSLLCGALNIDAAAGLSK